MLDTASTINEALSRRNGQFRYPFSVPFCSNSMAIETMVVSVTVQKLFEAINLASSLAVRSKHKGSGKFEFLL